MLTITSYDCCSYYYFYYIEIAIICFVIIKYLKSYAKTVLLNKKASLLANQFKKFAVFLNLICSRAWFSYSSQWRISCFLMLCFNRSGEEKKAFQFFWWFIFASSHAPHFVSFHNIYCALAASYHLACFWARVRLDFKYVLWQLPQYIRFCHSLERQLIAQQRL